MKLNFFKYFLILLVANKFVAQQQTVYTNIMLNQYIYNPAVAGVVKGTQFNIGYRNQWVGFTGAPKTLMLSGYGNLKKQPKMALGGLIYSDKSGLFQRTSFYASYSYQLKITKKASIGFGLSLGGVQYSLKAYDAKPYDRDDNFLSSQILNALAFDANSGFYFHTKKFFLGGSIQQMPNAKIHWDKTTGKLTNHFYAYTGYDFKLDTGRQWVIQPSILVRTSSPAPYQVEYNLKVIFQDMIWIGGSYRERSSAAFMVGCKLKKQFTFAYSYDFTTTDLKQYSSGSHEIVLAYYIPFQKKKSAHELAKDADENELNKIDNTLKTNLKSKKQKAEEKKEEEDKKAEEKKDNSEELKKTEEKTENSETTTSDDEKKDAQNETNSTEEKKENSEDLKKTEENKQDPEENKTTEEKKDE